MDNQGISLSSRDKFEDKQPATDGFKPAWALLSEPLLPAVVTGSEPVKGFKIHGFAATFFSKLAIQLQFGQSLTGIFRKYANSFASTVKSRVQMNGLYRVASCAFCLGNLHYAIRFFRAFALVRLGINKFEKRDGKGSLAIDGNSSLGQVRVIFEFSLLGKSLC